jgi:lipoprotein-anchoring transpeptidase ErfK/SrfK
VQAALANPAEIAPLVPNGGPNRTEVDLARQVLHLYQDGARRLTTHVSTGNNQRFCSEGRCDTAITPIGSFRYSWRATGWHEAPLGKLHNPVFFTSSGVAVHGSLSVPTYPASHGCVRIPMHISEYFPSLVRRGDPVYVTDGRPVGPPPVAPESPPSTLKPTTPGDDPSTTTTSTTAPPTTTTTAPTTTTVTNL